MFCFSVRRVVLDTSEGKQGAEALRWEGDSRWVEITVGLLGPLGAMRALTPSLTVKEAGDVLTLEEKFQVRLKSL